MKTQALQYYMHDGSAAFRFELSGDLNAEGARRLERDWYTASSVIGHRRLIVDMTFVTSADEDGRLLLARWHADGARLIAKSKVSRDLAEAIVGEPLWEQSVSDQTWRPFRTSYSTAALYLIVFLGVLLFPVQVHAISNSAVSVRARVQQATRAVRDTAGFRMSAQMNEDTSAADVAGGAERSELMAKQPASSPAGAGHMGTAPAVHANTTSAFSRVP